MLLVTLKEREQSRVTTRSERNRAARVRRIRQGWGMAAVILLASITAAFYGGPGLSKLWRESVLPLAVFLLRQARQVVLPVEWLLAALALMLAIGLGAGLRRRRRAVPRATPRPLVLPEEPVLVEINSLVRKLDASQPPSPVKSPRWRGLFTKPVLGIDVGNSQIKIVEVAMGQPPHILRYSILPTPRGSVDNGLIRDPALLSAAVSQAVSSGGFTTRRAATTLTGQNLMLRRLTLPPMPKKELRAAIDWQVEQVLQLNREDTLTDFGIMPTRPGEPNAVMLIAIQREPIINFVDFMQNQGFDITRVDIEPLAMFRGALWATQSVVKHGTHVFCDFGAGTTNLSIFREGVLQTARVIALGGNQLTRALMTEHDLDFSQAETEKIKHGLTPDSPYYSALSPVRDRLFGEINTTVNFYLTEHKGVSIDSVQIAGGNSLLPSLTQQLEQSFSSAVRSDHKKFRVHVANPLTRMVHGVSAQDLNWCGVSLCVAIGLALGEVEP